MIDADLLNDVVQTDIEQLCSYFFPNGKKVRNEWRMGDVAGTEGNSLGIQLTGAKAERWHDRATGEGGGFVTLLRKNRGVGFREAVALIESCLGINLQLPEAQEPPGNNEHANTKFDWAKCVRAFSERYLKHLASWRGYSLQFCRRLKEWRLIGIYQGFLAFPVQDTTGQIVGCHYYLKENRDWRYSPGVKVMPLIIGGLHDACQAHIFESYWDGLAFCDVMRFDWSDNTCALVVTRGAGNGGLVRDILPERSDVYLWPQRDILRDNGTIPSIKWLTAIVSNARRVAKIAWIPDLHPDRDFDLNNWAQELAKAGASGEEIRDRLLEAIQNAQLSEPALSGCVHGGNGGNGGIAGLLEPSKAINWGANPPNPPNPPSGHSQKAVYPADSILSDFFNFAVTQTEGADCYIIGSILPIAAAILGSAVWLRWGATSLHCNLFTMLAGKPGDRKSSTIDLAEFIARKCLPAEAFLPKAFSPETLFDEYDTESGGRPDKLLICDDANSILADWQKSANGERSAARFLELYDCKALSESYRRNRKEDEVSTQRRFIPHTSTSMVLGATFNLCMFRNQATRAGLQRRFLYYVAEGHGRLILYPEESSAEFERLAEAFALLGRLTGAFKLAGKARELFDKFQRENRTQINQSDSLDEPLLSRLSSAPTQTLKVAMIFEACRSVSSGSGSLEIQASTLQLAIDHVEQCLNAATSLDAIARRVYIANDAEVLLARVRHEFGTKAKDGAIVLARSDLTSKYANHGPGRGMKVQDLYGQLIPHLIERGVVQVLPKEGRLERYAFKAQD